MIVMKFGGTSVQDAQNISRVIEIVRSRLRERPLVVVSALARVTRLLVEMAEEAEARHSGRVGELMKELRARHDGLCADLLEGTLLEETLVRVADICSELSDFVDGVCQIGELSPRSRARIVSTGEVLSSTIVAAAMNARGMRCNWADARTMVITDDNYMSARPDLETAEANVLRVIPGLAKGADVVLTQGFIASTVNGSTSVLGFEGSDFSAAIFGMALGAERVEIWTDVDGIRTADPRVVPQTGKIDKISYEEAAEMAALGARVLHPLTIEPARRKNIGIRVLNTMNPEGSGSSVVRDDDISAGPKSIAFRTDIDYLEVVSPKIVGVTEMLDAVFSTMAAHKVAVSLASASQSKISLTFETDQPGARDAVAELEGKYDVTLYRDKAQLSVVGKHAVQSEGLTDKILDAAGRVWMVTAGSGMMSVSVVVDESSVKDVVNKLHKEIFE